MNYKTIILLALPCLTHCGLESNRAPRTSDSELVACPDDTSAVAFVLDKPALAGGLGGEGDVMLLNSQAAFVIQNPDDVKTYHASGGGLIDAAAMRDCKQIARESFGEMGFVAAKANLAAFHRSYLRAFHAERITIVNDGRDGQASHVRVYGRDTYFWLVELELILNSLRRGETKDLSSDFGIEMTIDYMLQPDSSVLTIDVSIANQNDEPQTVSTAATFLTRNPLTYFSDSSTRFGDYNLRVGVPWIATSDNHGATAIAIANANMATIQLAGMNVIFDLNQAIPALLGPRGTKTDTATTRMFVTVGDTDTNSASKHLIVNATPLEGRVFDAVTGEAVADATVELRLQNSLRQWQTIERLATNQDGGFTASIRGDADYRLLVEAPGRVPYGPATLDKLNIPLAPAGELAYQTNGPAKLDVYQNDKHIETVYTFGRGELLLVPGDYQVSVSRGFEYAIERQSVSIWDASATYLDVRLRRIVDTQGFVSMDGHVHGPGSPDAPITLEDRLATLVGSGVEVAVSTEHDMIVDWGKTVESLGLRPWLLTIVGSEVTAPSPEHTIAYPLVPDGSPRGGPVSWINKGPGEIFKAERARGAQIVSLNHPRQVCNYLCLVQWDRVAGKPLLTDPTRIGLPAGTALWSWDFDTVEYMNTPRTVFVDPAKPHKTGEFDDWTSFLNHGHRITAVGVTDMHDYEFTGMPRTYVGAPDLNRLTENDIVAALKAGNAQVSTGAFARVSIGNAQMGDTVTTQTIDLRVHIEALPDIDVTEFRVYANCDEVMRIDTTHPHDVVKYDDSVRVPLARDAHIVVLGFGKQKLPRELPQFEPKNIPRFTTNAIYVDYDGNGRFDAPGGKLCAYTID